MLGLYYSIIGLFSGIICSLIARNKSLSQKDWFTIGQILPGISVLLLVLITRKQKIVEMPFTNATIEEDDTATFADYLA